MTALISWTIEFLQEGLACLPEQAIAVAQAIAPGGKVECGHRVQEAGGQTAQAAVAQRRVALLADQVLQVVPAAQYRVNCVPKWKEAQPAQNRTIFE